MKKCIGISSFFTLNWSEISPNLTERLAEVCRLHGATEGATFCVTGILTVYLAYFVKDTMRKFSSHISYIFFYLHWEKQVVDQKFHESLISSYILPILMHVLLFSQWGENKSWPEHWIDMVLFLDTADKPNILIKF